MASLEPEPAGDEPEPQPDDGSVPERAPIAAPRGDGPDMMQQLQMQQLERMQLAVEFLTTPACRSAPKDKKVDYLKKQLKISDKEVEQAFGKAQDQLLQPAIDFLSNEQVRAQPIAERPVRGIFRIWQGKPTSCAAHLPFVGRLLSAVRAVIQSGKSFQRS